jgi:hypothetical protein
MNCAEHSSTSTSHLFVEWDGDTAESFSQPGEVEERRLRLVGSGGERPRGAGSLTCGRLPAVTNALPRCCLIKQPVRPAETV